MNAIEESVFEEFLNLVGLFFCFGLGYLSAGRFIATISPTEFPGTVKGQRTLFWPWYMTIAYYRNSRKKKGYLFQSLLGIAISYSTLTRNLKKIKQELQNALRETGFSKGVS